VQTVTINTEGTGLDVPLLLEWNQAYGAATSDLEILFSKMAALSAPRPTEPAGSRPTRGSV